MSLHSATFIRWDRSDDAAPSCRWPIIISLMLILYDFLLSYRPRSPSRRRCRSWRSGSSRRAPPTRNSRPAASFVSGTPFIQAAGLLRPLARSPQLSTWPWSLPCFHKLMNMLLFLLFSGSDGGQAGGQGPPQRARHRADQGGGAQEGTTHPLPLCLTCLPLDKAVGLWSNSLCIV